MLNYIIRRKFAPKPPPSTLPPCPGLVSVSAVTMCVIPMRNACARGHRTRLNAHPQRIVVCHCPRTHRLNGGRPRALTHIHDRILRRNMRSPAGLAQFAHHPAVLHLARIRPRKSMIIHTYTPTGITTTCGGWFLCARQIYCSRI